MEETNIAKNIRVQTVLKNTLYQRLQALRRREDRSESKMAAILIEEALNARKQPGRSA